MNMKSMAAAFSALVSVAAIGTAASAGTLSAQYFEIAHGTAADGDFGVCCSSPPATIPMVVLGSGLPNGAPVTTLSAAMGGVIDQSATGDILWWTPSMATGVSATGTGTFALDQLNKMFAPNSTGVDNTNFFETAIVSGTLTGTGADAKITVESDDDAFVYVNGLYVGGNPGVHGNESTTIDIGSFTGTKSLQVFFADRAQVDADLLVSVSGAGVPEPATWAMMLVGFGGLGAAMRSRRKQAAATA